MHQQQQEEEQRRSVKRSTFECWSLCVLNLERSKHLPRQARDTQSHTRVESNRLKLKLLAMCCKQLSEGVAGEPLIEELEMPSTCSGEY
jgi:hypothetical protein